MMGDLRGHLPTLSECSAVFDLKQHDPHAPPSLFTGSLPERMLFVSPDEESPQMETVCACGRDEIEQKH